MWGLLVTALNNPLCRRSSSCSLSVTLTMAPRSLMTEELKFSCSMTLATMARWRWWWRRRRGGIEAGGRGAARSPAGGESCHLGVCSVSVFSLSHKCFWKYFAGFDSFIQSSKRRHQHIRVTKVPSSSCVWSENIWIIYQPRPSAFKIKIICTDCTAKLNQAFGFRLPLINYSSTTSLWP